MQEKYLIFGGTGSLGKALIKRLAGKNHVVVYSRDESKHWSMRQEFVNSNLTFIVGDIRDFERCQEAIRINKPNHIIIASALKHVDVCEFSPLESVKTNILGVQNVVDAVNQNSHFLNGLKTVLLVSTDKACAPVNVYGECKAISERLVTSQSANCRSINVISPRFIGVRYGNVLESRGSIIPLFRHQAENFKEFTVTHKDMTRFVMTLDESVDLIQDAISHAESGDIWVPRLPAMRIVDLAAIFSERYNKPIKFTGMRAGEKIHEALICDAESVRVTDENKTKLRRYVIKPAYSTELQRNVMFSYTSADDVMTKQELLNHLIKLEVLDKPMSEFQGKTIEEIRTV